MRGGLPGDVTVMFDGNWDKLTLAVQSDIKSLFESILSRFINREYTKFQLSGIKNSNNFDNTIAQLRGQELNPIVLEHPKRHSPKRDSPKRDSPKRDSPKRHSPKR